MAPSKHQQNSVPYGSSSSQSSQSARQGQASSSSNSIGVDADMLLAMQLSQQLNVTPARPTTTASSEALKPQSEKVPEPQAHSSSAYASQGQNSSTQDKGKGKAREHSSALKIASFSEFAAQIRGQGCSKCSNRLLQGETDVTNVFRAWLNGQAPVTSAMKCKQCSATTCLGCGSQYPGSKLTNKASVDGGELSWCCSRGRLFIIWVLLCGLDYQYSGEKQADAVKSASKARNMYGNSGVGYGGGGGLREMMVMSRYGLYGAPEQANPNKTKADNTQAMSDSFNQRIMSFLSELLPSLSRSSTFDKSPPEAVSSMLISSKILSKAAELLRNDSLEDATKRKGLYQALLGFVRIIGTHPATADIAVYSERVAQDDSINLLTLSFRGSASKVKNKEATTSSLADCLRNLNIQSNMMLKSAQANKREFNTKDGHDMLWLCRQISDLAEYLLAKTKAGTGAIAAAKADAARNLEGGITDVPDNQVLSIHTYYQLARSFTSSPPGRMKRLVTEVTNLKTGLPPGIFVRYGASRLDVMKFLIVGPSGTPYELGLFEFDLICPIHFPFQPPQVWFRGTGGGRITINPNLHADGKVCLSLLGTWPGEPWRPAQSTILQVLVSIQAMIFCDYPLSNEPGLERGQNSQQSRHYNQQIRALTVRWAMLHWIEGGFVNPIWIEIASHHFRKNHDKIIQVVSRWAADSHSSMGAYGMANRMVMMSGGMSEDIHALRSQLKKAMRRYAQGGERVSTRQATQAPQGYGYGGNAYGGGQGGFGGYRY